jgi:hypothetical protein
MQLRFGVIREGPTVEDEDSQIILDNSDNNNTSTLKSLSISSLIPPLSLGKPERRRKYYLQNVYQTNFQKHPLVLVNHNYYMRTIEAFIKTHLKELQIKNKEDCETNHRIVAVYNLKCYLYNVGKPICGKQGEKSMLHNFMKNRYAYSIDESALCWYGCISFLIDPPKLKECVHERITKARQCFYDFYGYSQLDEISKKKKVDEYAGFMLVEEIDRFMSFFETGVNVFQFVEKYTCYKKQYSYVCKPQKAMFILNISIINFPKYQHAVWLKDSEKASECFVHNKCQYRVFHLKHAYSKHYRECDGKVKDKQLKVLTDDKIINPYFTQNPVVKYLYCTDQLDLFRPTQYYIVYDFETMEEIISKNDEQNTHIDIEDNNELNSSSSSSCDSNNKIVNKKSTDKMSDIILLSAAWCAKLKSGTKVG